jgi:cation diffusion facilitator family transporter
VSQALSAGERQRQISRAGIVTISANIMLTAFRVLAGVLSGSTAMIADAANSGTDIFATLVVMGGTRVAAQPPDPGHPYGHEKAEPVAAKIVGLIVTAAGVITFIGSLQALHAGGAEAVGAIALWVAGGSIIAKELLARYLTRVAKRTDNEALMADGANQRTDVLASGAALVGALGARLGYPILDPAMGLLVAGLILRMGLSLYWRSVTRLMDPAPEPETMAELTYAVATVDGVLSVDEVKARIFGSGIYVDCKICVDEDLTVAEGHRIAHRVKEAMRGAVDDVRDVLVHVNPCQAPHPLDGAARQVDVGTTVWAGGEAAPGDGEKHV